jgi:hypothetical protein
MNLSNKTINITAGILLVFMFFTAFFSMKQKALTFDELAHISAGYSYLTQQDYRLNPEHPPLVKDIPAIPLLFLDLNFPEEGQSWLQSDSAPAWWVQFNLGNEFLYGSGNNPKEIIFWSRLAMILMMVFLGWLLFYWTKKTVGKTAALGVLILFSFSPTFLAHGRLVNTDVGAVLGSFLSIIFWLKFLEKPSWKNVFWAGIFFGIAMLFKFSLILLIPFFAIITIIYALIFSKKIKEYLGKSILIGLTGFILVIWPVYQFHVWNYPVESQLRDTIADINGHPIPPAKEAVIWMTKQEFLRAPAQYLRGLLMASQRTAWGNTTYYLGEILAGSYWHYFPLLYLLKIPLAFHLLSLLALILLLVDKTKKKIRKENFWIIAFLVWIAIYWTAAIAGNLNIGIRHLLPVFPFTYILIISCLYWKTKLIPQERVKKATKGLILILFTGYIASSVSNFPDYISYYNEIINGTKEGYKIAVDSNYDWGQDFYYLIDFINNPPSGEKIEKIHLDYFGGESPGYWLKEKYVQLEPKKVAHDLQQGLTLEEAGIKGWVAVSLNQFMGGIAQPAPNFDQETGYYDWLKDLKPQARAGKSILIYKID